MPQVKKNLDFGGDGELFGGGGGGGYTFPSATAPTPDTPAWGGFTEEQFPGIASNLIGGFQWDPSQPFAGGPAYDYAGTGGTDWDAQTAFGGSAGTVFENQWIHGANPANIWGDTDYLQNVFKSDVGSWAGATTDPWKELAFMGGLSTGYNQQALTAFDTYQTGIRNMLDQYYGAGAGGAWEGALVTGTQAGYIPTPDTNAWNTPEQATGWTAPTADTSKLGSYYKNWADAATSIGTAGEGVDITGKDTVWHKLQDGTLSPSATAGKKVTDYFTDRASALTPYFGSGSRALEAWDADDPKNIAPMYDEGGTLTELTLDNLDTFDANAEKALQLYTPGSQMRAHIESMKGTKLLIDAKQVQIDAQDLVEAGKESELGLYGIDPETGLTDKTGEKWEAYQAGEKEFQVIESGDYAGLYEGQKTILQGMFGQGDYVTPSLGSPLMTARENITTVAEDWYVDTNFGEKALSTAIANTSDDQQVTMDAWDQVMKSASQSFFGIGDYSKQDLITLGFIDNDYNLLYDPTADSANEATTWNNATTVVHTDALENESEFAYQLRKNMGGENEEGAIGTYQNQYDTYTDTKIENLEQAHLDFQGDFESAASEFAQGQVGLKEKVAKQKGLRSGTTARVKEKLEQGIADAYGEDKLTWEDFNEKEKLDFDNNIELISNNLVASWELGFGDAGTLEGGEVVMDQSLGNIFGTFTYTPAGATAPITVPHTAETILEVMQAGFTPGGSFTLSDGRVITTNTKGDYGTAFDKHKTDKFGLFGKTDLTAGYSPGPNKKFGDADDETFVGAGNVAAGKLPAYASVDTGWQTGAISSTDLYAGVKLPTAVGADMEPYSTGGIFGTGLRNWIGTFTGELGGATATETGLLTEAEIDALEATTPGSATEAVKYAGVTEGAFGDVATEQAEDLATYQLGEAALEIEGEQAYASYKAAKATGAGYTADMTLLKDEPAASIQQKFFSGGQDIDEMFGSGTPSEAYKIQAFEQAHVTDQTATMADWQAMFTKGGINNIDHHLKALQSSVSGAATGYMDFIQERISLNQGDNTISKLMGLKWDDYDELGNLKRVADPGPGESPILAGQTDWDDTSTGEKIISVLVIACMLFCWSDRKLKKNIRKVGTHKGLNVYKFNYIWDDKEHTGFMADEVEKVVPEAVIKKGNYKMVNYSQVYRSL